MISTSLNDIFQKSIFYAKKLQHEYLTIEHVFYTLLESADGASIVNACGGDTEDMKKQLYEYIVLNIDKVQEYGEQEPHESVALSRVIDNMLEHIQNSSQTNADVGDLLVSIYNETESFSYALLNAYQISKLDILEYISHSENITQSKEIKDEEGSFLSKYCIDLVQKAKDGKIDPVIGRKKEIKRTIQILCRRKKNNPILVGEAGVGKTAIAEGLAICIKEKTIAPILKETKLFALDLSSLLAGTKYRGDFEKRLKGVMDELKNHPDSILFIDEIHTLIGAGATSGTMDAANQLKPALASGELRCIGATTFNEYRNGFAKDKALARRFSKVDINEPDIKTSYKILKGLKEKYEKHHNIIYTDKALKSAVKLSKRYITEKFLPDVAIDVIDETAASFHLKKRKKQKVTVFDIKKTISLMAGIQSFKVTKDETLSLKHLESSLKTNVMGQNLAIENVTKAIKISKAGLTPPNKPIASFLFVGPTGVGKTELAISISKVLGINFERFDMSEYMEKHALSRLVGAPPGYVGYEQGGLLTEAIKKHPHSVLLLDEIEKAHPDLINILLQIMDNASLTDNNGYKADFQNVILIMTSNIGATSKNIMGFNKDDSILKNEDLKLFFTPEFRNRLDNIIEFKNLDMVTLKNIVEKLIKDLNNNLKTQKISLQLSDEAIDFIATSAYSKEMGARPLKRFIQENIVYNLTNEILFGKLKKGGRVEVGLKNKNFIFNFKAL